MLNSESLQKLKAQLDHRPSEKQSGDESQVVTPIIERLLETVGFSHLDRITQFKCNDHPSLKTDIACRLVDENGNSFFNNQKNPQIICEIKCTNYQLSNFHKQYWEVHKQLKSQLLGNYCKNTPIGVISNGWEIQLFRHDHKITHPLTPLIELNSETAEKVAEKFLQSIKAPKRGSIIGVYNNKGGIGKTTTVSNVGIVLAQNKRKVLLVDFDPNQGGLTKLLKLSTNQGNVWNYLKGITPLDSIIQSYSAGSGGNKVKLDVITADSRFLYDSETDIEQQIRPEFLRNKLLEAAKNYDYILVDMPPNWRWFAQVGLLSLDALLVPAHHNDWESIQNLESVITLFLPQVGQMRKMYLDEGMPALLPLVLNRYNATPAQSKNFRSLLDKIISSNPEYKQIFNNFFYVENHGFLSQNKRILELGYHVEIANAAMQDNGVPGPIRYRKARDVYQSLIREVITEL
ncbi:ParA family protein [Thermosynechococcaceae cyanobacterium BACA0444]|uniref:ParA family protein n=1 Tax=Pseudocalidococcus azoricus BACA0444 TaxID=2918990 RepID=A0AAE4FPX7_9CYAN|nr:ParA family protein [Pseudocalidococcus azoricus]MDS3859955.1 ParA family protein [Pseudocalidococcus azoricus BACA0444]